MTELSAVSDEKHRQTADAPELAAIAQIADVESILEICAQATGMRYCVVAHVTEDRWLACAVLDRVEFGLPVGGELPIKTTLCNEVRETRATIAFDHASADDKWRTHSTPLTYGLESYIAAPIILANGAFFGTLCAIDPQPAPASRSDVVRMFQLFAKLIANFLDAQIRVESSEAALLDAQETSLLREQFIAVLGHDLRNPLAALDAGLVVLNRRIGDDRVAPILKEMKRSSSRMERLISDVLDFARGRLGGGLTIARHPSTDLHGSLHHVVSELQTAHAGRRFNIDIARQLEVQCDPDRIAQMMSNLLANAISHGDEAKPIDVVAKMDGATFEMSVANGGAPIPSEILPCLFQPFNRRNTTEVRDGLGLGLYICSQIASAHGGVLTVSSDNEETRFVFQMSAKAMLEPSRR